MNKFDYSMQNTTLNFNVDIEALVTQIIKTLLCYTYGIYFTCYTYTYTMNNRKTRKPTFLPLERLVQSLSPLARDTFVIRHSCVTDR